VAATALLASAGLAGPALALPQQQGSVDLLNQSDGQWDGPGEAQGGSGAGSAVAGLPDVFGRGVSALAIGAPEANPGGQLSAGSVYVVAATRGTGAVDLTALAGRGVRLDGAAAGDQAGFALAPLTLPGGDPGLAVGAPYSAPVGRAGAGTVYVIDLRHVRGGAITLGAPSRAVVAVIRGAGPCDEAGYALAAAAGGLLIGAPGWDPHGCAASTPSGPVGGNTGAAWWLPLGGLRGTVDLAAGRGIRYAGAASGDRTGAAVAGGPGDRLLVGAPYASPLGRAGAGAVYVIALPRGRTGAVALPSGATTIAGAAANDALGFALATTTGFVPGEGPELVVGAPQASPLGRSEAGRAYVLPLARVHGASLDLNVPVHGATVIEGADPGDEAGYAVAGLGSLNGNGRPSIAVGAPFTNSQTGTDRIDNGAAYGLYGGGRSGYLDLARLGARGVAVYGARNSDEAGTALAGLTNGDGDGRPALLVGAPFAESPFGPGPVVGGAVYRIFGWGAPAIRYPASALVLHAGRRVRLRARLAHTGPARVTVSPMLPAGLRLDPRTGTIAGIPRRAAPTRLYTLTLSDLAGTAQTALTLTVLAR
jgi:hypothetical protein